MTGLRLLIACVLACALQGVGLVSTAAAYKISGYVWVDANANKRSSIWEPKFPGATVKLLNASTNAVMRVSTTDALGNYALLNISAGTYRLTLTLPPGHTGAVNSSIVVSMSTVKNFGIAKVRSVEEKALNKFGDRWSQARANPWLPRAASTGCYRTLPPGMKPIFTAEELEFHKRLANSFYLEGCAAILETDPPFANDVDDFTAAMLKARALQFKTANPSLKYLGYQRPTNWNVGQVGWTDIYDNHRDWFLYKKGTTTQTEENIVLGENGAWILDITNPAFRNYLAPRLAQALAYYKIDGLVLDEVAPLPRVADISTMPDAKRAAWQGGWVAFLTKLKAAMGPNRYLFASVPRDNTPHAQKIIPVVDGIMLEDTFSPVRNSVAPRLAQVQPIFNVAKNAGKWILTTANTFVDGSTFGTTSAAKEHVLERYYLAAFYVFNTGKMLFHYNPPSATIRQYAAQSFFTDWNIKVGPPTGAYSQIPGRPGVYRRNYTHAVVYLNNTTSQYKIIVPAASAFNLDPDGAAVTSYVLPPKSGYILSRAQAFQ